MDLQNLQEKKQGVVNQLNASKQLLAKAEQSMQKVNAQIIRLSGQLDLLNDMITSMEAEIGGVQEEPTAELDEQ